MRIGVMIPTYNEEKHIALCLNSLLRQTIRPIQVVIGDNESTDCTREIAAKLLNESGIEFQIVTEGRTLELGKWNISFVYWRTSQYLRKDLNLVACLEADVVLAENYYEVLAHGFKDPRIGLACGALLPWGFPESSFPLPESWRKSVIWGPNRVYKYSCWLDLNRAVDLRLLPAWDTDHNVLAATRGWKIAQFEEAVSHHLRPANPFRGFSKGLVDRYQGYPAWWILRKALFKTFDPARLVGYGCMAVWGVSSPLKEIYRQAVVSELRRQISKISSVSRT